MTLGEDFRHLNVKCCGCKIVHMQISFLLIDRAFVYLFKKVRSPDFNKLFSSLLTASISVELYWKLAFLRVVLRGLIQLVSLFFTEYLRLADIPILALKAVY